MSAAEQVQMDMVNGLSCLGVGIKHEAEAAFSYAAFGGDLICDLEQMSDKGVVFFFYLKGGGYMLFRDHEHMHGRLRIEVPEGHGCFILMNNTRRDFF